jgi:hypothetical protein
MPVKLFTTLALSALVLAPAAASAQQQTGQQQTGQQGATAPRERSAEVGDGNRIICRTSGVTGSRVKSGRICMTADEWAAQKRDTRNRVDQEQQRRSSQDN